MWTASGGDFASAVSASRIAGGTGFYTWGSTARMIGEVQHWLNTPSENFGWILIGDESVARTAQRLDSRESLTEANRPALTIQYTPPTLLAARHWHLYE